MTAAAKTQVVNAALAHLGEEPVADIAADPPSPKLAKILAQLDGPAGVEAWVVKRHAWLCTLTWDTLEPAPGIGNWKWLHVFVLPDTFAHLWECSADAFSVGRLEIGAAVKPVIFTNDATLNVSYGETKPYEAYDADLAAVIAYELAARTAGPLQNNYDAARRLHASAMEAIDLAQSGEAGQHGDDFAMVPSNLALARQRGSF